MTYEDTLQDHITDLCLQVQDLKKRGIKAVEATLGRGECHDSNNRFNAWQCSECGATVLLMFDDFDEPTLPLV